MKIKKDFHTLEKLVVFRLAIISIILGFGSWSVFLQNDYTDGKKKLFLLIAITYAVSIANILVLKLDRVKKPVSYLQFAFDAVLVSLVVSTTGSASAFSLYLLVIACSALVFDNKGSIIVAAICGISYSLLCSGIFDFFAANLPKLTQIDIISVYLSLISIALITSFLAKKVDVLGKLIFKQQNDLDHLNQSNQNIINNLQQGILSLDLNLNILSINKASLDILNLNDESKYIGKNINTIFETFNNLNFSKFLKSKTNKGEIELANGNENIKIGFLINNVISPDNNKSGFIIFLNDLTKIRDIEEKLNNHEHMAKLLASKEINNETEKNLIEMIGESDSIKNVQNLIKKISSSNASVLITGESGTGKELIAKSIHFSSDRADKPFVAVNCGAIPESLIESELFGHKKGAYTGAISDTLGLFRQANNGTIFLDEIGELPLQLQSKLLRTLQEKKVRPVGSSEDFQINVRVICATNRNLKQEVEDKNFRDDLFYRINVVGIDMPPLRDRKKDIPLLVKHFINKHFDHQLESAPVISPEALNLLLDYNYPGNIRELENLIERALVLGGSAILAEHLLLDNTAKSLAESAETTIKETNIVNLPLNLEKELEKLERELLFQALETTQGNKTDAAKLLGLNFRSFRYRVKKYDLDKDAS